MITAPTSISDLIAKWETIGKFADDVGCGYEAARQMRRRQSIAVGIRRGVINMRKTDRKIVRNSARCLLCGDEIESKHRHDFRSCKCGNVSVDGGKDYIRRAYAGERDSWINTSIFEEEESE